MTQLLYSLNMNVFRGSHETLSVLTSLVRTTDNRKRGDKLTQCQTVINIINKNKVKERDGHHCSWGRLNRHLFILEADEIYL